ncbi:MAG: TolC family protein [Vicinamibacterales bacterium]
MRTRFRIAVLASVLLTPAAIAAGQETVPTPITLTQGVTQALDKAAIVALARQDVNAQEGALRQARGTFDASIVLSPGFEHHEDNIENTAFFNPERVKRGFATGLHTGFGAIADSLGQQIALGRGDLPLCPTDGSYSSYFVTLPGTVLSVPVCRPASLTQGSQALDDPNNFNFRQALPFDPLSSFTLQTVLASAFRVQLATQTLEVHERANELLLTLQAAARSVEVKAGLIEQRLGALPEFVYSNTLSFDGQIVKPFRNGTIFQFSTSFDGKATQFRDKPIDPKFGGTDVPNNFGNRIEVALIQPLKRGRGADTVRAVERSAQKNLDASRFAFQQTAADQALATADAYFGLMEAEETLALTQASLATQRRLLDTTTRLAAAGDIAAAEVTRSRARTTAVATDVESARLAVLSAQGALADAMGAAGSAAPALATADTFPPAPLAAEVTAVPREAINQRADVKALSTYVESSRVFLAAARAETRARFDLRMSGGFAQRYFGPTFQSLGDENGQHLTNDLYVKYYDPTGFWRGLKSKWEPIGLVTATFQLPIGNNQALGRLAQAQAAVRDSEIRVTDLARSIQHNVPKLLERIDRLRNEWAQQQDVVVQYGTALDDAQRLWGAGNMTLFDTLVTEQQLTSARLRLVQIKRDYASAVARLRRETGTLVTFAEWSQPQLNLSGLVVAR